MPRLNMLLVLTLFVTFGASQAFFSNFASWFHFDSNGTKAKNISEMTAEELGISRGQCVYDFLDYVLFGEKERCAVDDHYILHLHQTRPSTPRKPPIMVKCLQSETWLNDTNAMNSLVVIDSMKQMARLISPIGNATKRHEPGNCLLIFFYTDTCPMCIEYAPKVIMLPFQFPKLRVAALDVMRFPHFNTELGIVGLPTLLLFHQGRPIVKYSNDMKKYSSFVRRHTGIYPVSSPRIPRNYVLPLPLQVTKRTDYVLFLAWSFILLCMGKYFAKSQLCKQIVEMVKRNWRESEAQMEHN